MWVTLDDPSESLPEGFAKIDWRLDRDGMVIRLMIQEDSDYSMGSFTTLNVHETMCMSPCIVAVRPGVKRFISAGEGRVASSIELDLRKGREYVVVGRSGSAAVEGVGYGLVVVGVIALTYGVVGFAVDQPRPAYRGLTIAGGALTVAGIPFIVGSRSKMTLQR